MLIILGISLQQFKVKFTKLWEETNGKFSDEERCRLGQEGPLRPRQRVSGDHVGGGPALQHQRLEQQVREADGHDCAKVKSVDLPGVLSRSLSTMFL